MSGVPYAAVVSYGECGVQIVSLADPASPSPVATIGEDLSCGDSTLLDVTGIDIFEHSGDPYAVTTANRHGSIQVINLADPSNPVLTGNITDALLEGVRKVTTFELSDRTYAAASSFKDSIHIIDISVPSLPAMAGVVHDTSSTLLAETDDITTFYDSGNPYLALTSFAENGVQVVRLTNNKPPVVSAGPDRTFRIDSFLTTTLSGDASDPEKHPMTYLWTHNSTDPNVIILDDAELAILVRLPSFSQETDIAFTLTATDEHGARSSDTMVLSTVFNRPPTVEAGPDQTVNEGEPVTITGTVDEPEGDLVTSSSWTYQPADPIPGLHPQNLDAPSLNFTAPGVTSDTVYTFELSATDEHGAVGRDTMRLTVLDVPNPAPVVDAGPDQTVNEGATVTLSGTATDPDGDDITYQWSCTGWPDARVDPIDLGASATTLSPTFTAPQLTLQVTLSDILAYKCTFTATDIYSSSASDSMTLFVRDVPTTSTDRPVVRVIGEPTPTIARNSAWTDPGATCETLLDGSPLPITIKITLFTDQTGGKTVSSVSTSTEGEYRMKYMCTHNGILEIGYRTVTVEGGNALPTISIVNIRSTIAAGNTSPDIGSDASCNDREDGRLAATASVTYRNDGTATIRYTCTDSGGESASVSLDGLHVTGSAKPEIRLRGDISGGSIYVNVGDTFTDPGADCINAEGRTFNNANTTGTVDTSTAGKYTLIYECIDRGVRSSTAVFVYVIAEDLPPVLKITGDRMISIPVNGTWSLPSATCIDKEDGDITALITYYGIDEVDVTKPGVYSVTHFCTDSADQQVQTWVRITVEAP